MVVVLLNVSLVMRICFELVTAGWYCVTKDKIRELSCDFSVGLKSVLVHIKDWSDCT